MRDYDKPKAPANTPPVIDPGAQPENPAGTKADGELPAEDTEDDKVEVEKALGNAQEGGRDGAGEAALDSPPPD
tara:strand:- start:66257 stop:66478 length:222 start_codon:yes stop_codon:yes gene_type:complete